MFILLVLIYGIAAVDNNSVYLCYSHRWLVDIETALTYAIHCFDEWHTMHTDALSLYPR
jgi:hypothetical protein